MSFHVLCANIQWVWENPFGKFPHFQVKVEQVKSFSEVVSADGLKFIFGTLSQTRTDSVLQLAMVKNQRLAEKLVKGKIYDCVCKYEPAR